MPFIWYLTVIRWSRAASTPSLTLCRRVVFTAAGRVGGEEDADRFAGEPVPLCGGGTLAGVELGLVKWYGHHEVGEVRCGEARVVSDEQAARDIGL